MGPQYPLGTRALFWLHRLTACGVHELYQRRWVRWLVTALDRFSGKV